MKLYEVLSYIVFSVLVMLIFFADNRLQEILKFFSFSNGWLFIMRSQSPGGFWSVFRINFYEIEIFVLATCFFFSNSIFHFSVRLFNSIKLLKYYFKC